MTPIVSSQPDDVQHIGDAVLPLDLRQPGDLQSEFDITPHGHVRPERIGLENHAELAVFRRQAESGIGDGQIIEQDFAVIRTFQSGNDPEQRSFPATRRTQQRKECTIRNRERCSIDSGSSVEGFMNIACGQPGHESPPSLESDVVA